jgi:radical SAM protein with 4Fe4S-binding SPASM domain
MDVWRNGKSTKIMRNIALNNECKTCKRKMICHGECPAIRLYATGTLNGLAPSCLKSMEVII